MTSLYAILGGTFNPIHYGHIVTAEILAKKIRLNTITLLPNYTSLHQSKLNIATEHRIQMIKLAVKNKPLFKINYLEIKKKYYIL
ncbi:MAG: adenylyltransferase/cytidyltransferase family protein [Buchnera aphidicola (Kaburagia rhusicola ensigallis)]